MEIAAAATGETVKCSIGHLEREINYLVYFRRNVDKLKCKLDQLKVEKREVEERIRAATNNNEKIKETVNKWLSDVVDVQTDAYVIRLTDEAGQISSCFKGWFCSRFRLRRKAYQKNSEIQALLDRRNNFGDTVSDPIPIQSLERISAYDYKDFASRKSLTNEILKALVNNDNICLVGIFGMPGIGKTKLVEVLSKRMKEEKLFDEVVMVTISQNPDVKTIQNNVGKQLGMQLEDNDSISDRAMRLHHRLKTQDKKIVIMLDDLWDELKLEEVGIPRKSGCKSYKIVITTRFEQVCRQMETDMELKVPVLSKHDSWTLFLEKVGDVVVSLELEEIARKVVDECAGLPLAIVTLGKTLRKQTSVNVWANMLRRLQKSIHEDSMAIVDSSIKLSYDFLSNEVQKRCFLCCSLFPEDYNISIMDDLLIYVVGEKLLEDGKDCFNSLEETKVGLDSIVEDLISSSLLLRVSTIWGYKVGYIKMHDVVRDVAKMIASKDEEFKQQVDAVPTELMKWPEKLESCKRLLLMPTKITCNLPSQVEAPQLLTLILTGCKDFSELPCDFFKKMKILKNLNLSDTGIASLPQSISCLAELVTLRLRKCSSLKSISAVVGKLEKLEILDLCESGIETLSEEMGMLTNLKSLNMSFMDNLESISPKVISSMCQLEELYVFQWRIEMERVFNANSNFMSEVASLAKLSCVEISVPNVECLSINATSSSSIIINWVNNLKQFYIHVGVGPILYERGVKRRLCVVEIPSSSISVPREFIWLLRRADSVRLEKCNDLESVVQLQVDPTATGGGFKDNNLKRLEVLFCSEMKYLMSSIEVEKSPEISFSSLQELVFAKMDNLESICNGKTLPEGFLHNLRELRFDRCFKLNSVINWESQNLGNTSSGSASTSSCRLSLFSNLRNLTLISCKEIRYVLPMSVARGLNQLVEIWVSACPSIEMIIANDNGEEDDGDNYILPLPRLEILLLGDLPALVSFGRPGLVFDWDSLKELHLGGNFGNLKSLPCRVTQQRLSKFKVFELDPTLIHLLEDPAIIIDDLELKTSDYRGEPCYSKKKEAE